MTIAVKIVNGVVAEMQADHPYELLYTSYCLGVLPPVLAKGDAKGRLEKWAAWLEFDVDDGDVDVDDDSGDSGDPHITGPGAGTA